MRRNARRAIAMGVACGALLTMLVASGPGANAANTVPFTPKFSANANGSILTVGNNLLTCSPFAFGCSAARAGGAYDNNAFVMGNLDADSDFSTENSSMSRLSLPSGSTVLWAGLYWGARLQPGSGGSGGNAFNINRMSLRIPGATDYQTINASTAARDQFGPNNTFGAYQRFADVTTLVRQAGTGAYWGGNVEAATGVDTHAGWSLTVAYSAPGMPLRNLTVFDGFDVVSIDDPETITVSGFQAPLEGTVDTQLTMVTYEGDVVQTGDFARLNNTQLASPVSPGSNFFRSTNELNGASVTTRTPADRNQLGFDIKNIGASGAIPNGATSARFTFSSNGDLYYPGVVGMAINLYAPDFGASSKTVVNTDGNTPARPGDVVQYTLNYANTGQDPALEVTSTDPLPDTVTYVPGSLALLSPLGVPTPLSDAAGDDVGEYDAASRTVRARLGSGATATAGGRMACSATGCTFDGTSRAAYTFKVRLDDAAAGTTVANVANLDYRTATTNTAASSTTPPATIEVGEAADLRITKTMTPDPAAHGAPITATINLVNDGPSTAQDVIVNDVLPEGWVNDSTDVPPEVTCTTVIRCTVGSLAAGASRVIVLHGHLAAGATVSSLTNVASVSTSTFDPDQTNNSSAASISLVREADLVISGSAAPTAPVAGSAVTYTLTVRNDGPSDAEGVVFNSTLDDPSQVTSAEVIDVSGGAICPVPSGSKVECTIATLPAGATSTITVRGRLATGLPEGTVVSTSATVASATTDPDTSNNQASTSVTTSAPSADVRVSKTGPATVVAGEPVTWSLTATNAGPSDAAAVTVTDNAPPGVTFTGATTARGVCTTSATSVTCTLGTLQAPSQGSPTAPVTMTVFGVLDASATGVLSNTATAASSTSDPVPENNAATSTSDVEQEFDVEVAKTANRASLPAATPEAPQPVVYSITVTNDGPSVATGITLTDLIPTALEFVSVTPPAGDSCAAPTAFEPDHDQLICSLDQPIAVGESKTVVVNMEATSDLAAVGEDVTETVTVSAPDGVSMDDSTASWTLSGEPSLDLSLEKSLSGSLVAGRNANYAFEVFNTAIPPDSVVALAPTVVDTLPPGLTLVPAGGPGSVTPSWCTAAAPTAAGQDVTCSLPADIGPNTQQDFAITVQPAPGLDAGETVANTAQVVEHPSNTDVAPGNNVSDVASVVSTEADVVVAGLTVVPRVPGATGAGTWRDATFTIRNDGPSDAVNGTIRIDIEPDALADTSTLPPGCVASIGQVACTLTGVLPAGAASTLEFGFALAGSVAPGDYDVSVQASSATPDPAPANNIASTTFSVGEPATQLEVSKTAVDTVSNPEDSHPSFVAGTPFTYQVQVSVPNATGNGVADAHGVFLTDVVPEGFLVTDVSTTQGSCQVTDGGAGIACDLGTIAAWPGNPAPVIVRIHGLTEASTHVEQAVNTATATATTLDATGVPASADGAAVVDVIEQADLQLFKAADATVLGADGMPTFIAGGDQGFVLTAVNAGPSDVTAAQIVDTLPPGLTLDVDDTPGCQVTGGAVDTGLVVTCDVGIIGVGESVPVRLVTNSTPDDGAPTPEDPRGRLLTNTASLTSEATDPALSNNEASATARLERLVDIAISSGVSTKTPAAGGDITVTASYVNNGPSAAYGGTGESTFPPGWVPVSTEIPLNVCNWNQTPPADPTSVPWQDFSYELTCVAADPDAAWFPGHAETAVVVMYIPRDTPEGEYTGTVSNHTETPEINLDNNFSQETVFVQQIADTAVVKELVTPDPMVAGQPVTWRITTTNSGPSDADEVVISDVVPDGTTYVSAEIEGGEACPPPEEQGTVEGGDTQTIIRCTISDLVVGESASVLVTLQISPELAGQQLCNEAVVGSGSLDETADDNVFEVCGLVAAPPAADVGVAVTPDAATHLVGDTVTYTATVDNSGPDPATGVVAVFDVPAGLTEYTIELVSSPGPLADCVIAGVSATCTIGGLASGDEVVYRITGVAAGAPGDVLTVTGTTTHGEADPVVGNDTDDAAVTLVAPPSADVGVAVTPDAATHLVGDTVTYTATVENSGPDPATGVAAAFDVPAGLTGYTVETVSAPGQLPDCAVTGGTASCTIGGLASGAEVVYRITGVAAGSPGDVLTVTGTTTHDEADPVVGNDTDNAVVTLVAQSAADVALTIKSDAPTHLVGDTITYTATIHNNGPGAAAGVVASFDVPDGLTGYSGSPVPRASLRAIALAAAPANCVVGTALTCTVGDLPSDDEVVYRIVGVATGSPGSVLTLTGTATHAGGDPVGGNNTDAAAVTLVASAAPAPSAPPSGTSGTATPSPDTDGANPETVAQIPGPSDGSASGDSSGLLPATGAEVLTLLLSAAAAIAAGMALLLRNRRRRA